MNSNRRGLLTGVFTLCVFATSTLYAQPSRNLRAQRFILDDNAGHLLTVQLPALTGNGSITLPQPGAGLFQSNSFGVLDLVPAGLSGNILISNGTSWVSGAQSAISSLGTIGTGIWHGSLIGTSYGGTNTSASPTAGAISYGTGTAYAFNSVGSSGQVLVSGGSGAPTFTGALSGIAVSGASGSFTTATSTGATTLATGANLTNSFGTGTAASNTIGVAAGLNQINGSTTFGGTVAFGTNSVSGSNLSITGGSISNVPVAGSTGGFTTLTSSGSTTLGTGSTTTNSFGTGLSAANTIGAATGTNQINGTTTFGGAAAFGANAVTGSNVTISGGAITNTPVSGSTGAFSTTGTSTPLTGSLSGAQTASVIASSISNTATNSTTAALTRTGLSVASTGTWTGGANGASVGIGLSVSGGSTNKDINGTSSTWSVTNAGTASFATSAATTALGGSTTPVGGTHYKDNAVIAWGDIDVTGTSITTTTQFGNATVARTGVGVYTVTLPATPTAAAITATAQSTSLFIAVASRVNNVITIKTYNASATAADVSFFYSVMVRP
jgi:hypothetical protein